MNKHSICISRNEMELSVKAYFGVDSEYYFANAVWQAYSAMLRNEGSFQTLDAIKRNTGKTLTCAIVAALARNHFNRDVIYTTQSQGQYSIFCRYLQQFGVNIKDIVGGPISALLLTGHFNPSAIVIGDELYFSDFNQIKYSNPNDIRGQSLLFALR